MQQWEHLFIEVYQQDRWAPLEVLRVNFGDVLKPRPDFMQVVNELGHNGWELVSHVNQLHGQYFAFKRPVLTED